MNFVWGVFLEIEEDYVDKWTIKTEFYGNRKLKINKSAFPIYTSTIHTYLAFSTFKRVIGSAFCEAAPSGLNAPNTTGFSVLNASLGGDAM